MDGWNGWRTRSERGLKGEESEEEEKRIEREEKRTLRCNDSSRGILLLLLLPIRIAFCRRGGRRVVMIVVGT